MTRTLCVPREDKIVLSIPHSYVGEELEVLVFPLSETKNHQTAQPGAFQNDRGIGCLEGKVWMADGEQKRKPGCARGQIWMADDFDAPLEEFKDYM
jgi:hypothetical protein